jgi:PAS domain S-box-containing protein
VYVSLSYAPVRDEAGAVGGVLVTLVDTTAEVAARQLHAERAHLAAALEVERTRLATVFRQSPSFLAVLRGPDNVFDYVNAAYEQIIGRGRDVVGRPLFEALPESRGQGFDDYLGRVRATGEPLVFRDLPVLLDRTPGAPREERFIDITYLPLVEADGSHDAVIAHGTDVTEQVHARRAVEALLAASEATRAELAATNAQLQDQQIELELASHQMQESAVELETQAETLQAAAAELEERTEAAERARAASDAARADAERARVETDRVLAATDDGLLGTDLAGRTTFVNPAAERTLGYAAAELVGRPQHALIHHTRADGTPYPAAECPLSHARQAGTSTRVEGEVFWRKDGTAVPVDYAMTPVVEDGAVVGTVVTFRDVSARQAADAERARLLAAEQAARRDAEAADRAKAEFLATMSHELRTPLNAIGGYAELLELGIRGPVSEAQRADLARIQQSQRHLLGLVNEVLDLAKIDAGGVRVDRAPVPVASTIDAALALVRPQAAAKPLALDDACQGAGELTYLGDEPRVRQILVNLLANAVKFTPAGGRVSVSCALTGGPPPRAAAAGAGSSGGAPAHAGPYVALRVADTGVGIAPADAERVFQPFTQAGRGTNTYTRRWVARGSASRSAAGWRGSWAAT